jgi:rod shape determining protein RodA
MLGVDYMQKVSRFKTDGFFYFLLLAMAITSIITIYSAMNLASVGTNFALRQALWYAIGYIMIYGIMFIGNDFFIKNAYVFYGIGIVSLVLLLVLPDGPGQIARPVNGSHSWFHIPGVGTLQPAEYMKIALVLTQAKIIDKFNKLNYEPTLWDEFVLILKIAISFLIPAALIFVQPETGIIIIMAVMTFLILFASGIRWRWFVIAVVLVGIFVLGFLYLLEFRFDILYGLLGKTVYRLTRLTAWQSSSGFQLERGLIAMGSAGLTGHGYGAVISHFPEPQTDYIFVVFTSNFGFLGAFYLLLLVALFDYRIIQIGQNSITNIERLMTVGFVGMLIYQQFQNIGMTLGLVPITGITLPFISYGGSSLLSYMIMIGLVFNIANRQYRYTN